MAGDTCAGEVADLLEMSEQDVVERMLKHALPPLVEAGNKSALEVLAGKIGSDPQNLLQNYGHTIIAKCLYEGGQYACYLALPNQDLYDIKWCSKQCPADEFKCFTVDRPRIQANP